MDVMRMSGELLCLGGDLSVRRPCFSVDLRKEERDLWVDDFMDISVGSMCGGFSFSSSLVVVVGEGDRAEGGRTSVGKAGRDGRMWFV